MAALYLCYKKWRLSIQVIFIPNHSFILDIFSSHTRSLGHEELPLVFMSHTPLVQRLWKNWKLIQTSFQHVIGQQAWWGRLFGAFRWRFGVLVHASPRLASPSIVHLAIPTVTRFGSNFSFAYLCMPLLLCSSYIVHTVSTDVHK